MLKKEFFLIACAALFLSATSNIMTMKKVAKTSTTPMEDIGCKEFLKAAFAGALSFGAGPVLHHGLKYVEKAYNTPELPDRYSSSIGGATESMVAIIGGSLGVYHLTKYFCCPIKKAKKEHND